MRNMKTGIISGARGENRCLDTIVFKVSAQFPSEGLCFVAGMKIPTRKFSCVRETGGYMN